MKTRKKSKIKKMLNCKVKGAVGKTNKKVMNSLILRKKKIGTLDTTESTTSHMCQPREGQARTEQRVRAWLSCSISIGYSIQCLGFIPSGFLHESRTDNQLLQDYIG